MNDQTRTNQELLEENSVLKQGIQELEKLESERKRAEDALLESEEKYRVLFEGINDAVFVHDLDHEGLSGRFLQVNNVACRRLGYTRDELLSLTPRDITTSEEYNRIANKRIILASQGNILAETVHVTKDGRSIPVESNIRQFQYFGKQVALSISRDITLRKQAEAEKAEIEAQNQQLQKAESLGRMAGSIAHHFNNQLGVVIGNLEMAIDDLPQSVGPVHSLNAAMQAAQKAVEMSGLMLTYLGQTPGKHEPIDLSETCLQSITILRAIMPGKVLLETDLPSSGPAVSANANQIQQVLTNLVTNAWEAVGNEGGTIHLRVKSVSPAEIPMVHRHPIGWQPQNTAYACLEVTDGGCGIAGNDIEKLFDPFFSSKFTGRGMGLAVVIGIVRAHGGVVTVESELGRGSTFRVFFPMSVEERLRQPDKVPEFEGGGTVLLVEDEEMVRNMVAAMLKRLGFSVLEAKDGVEAVDVFRQHQDEIRCVLSDLTMPRMNGWETLTALRKLAPGIPVILASGYDEAHVMSGDHPELPQVFLGKPYKLKGLGDAISQALVNRK